MSEQANTRGAVSILNVGGGDIELRFDRENPAECLRAGRIVKDMLRRGYALLVEVEREDGKKFERALDFDEKAGCYIIADFDPVVAMGADKEGEKHGEEPAGEADAAHDSADDRAIPKKRRGRPTKAVDASGARAVAVGRSAGG